MIERKRMLKLTTKTHTGFGIASTGIGFLSFLLFVAAVFTSAFGDRGNIVVQYRIGILEIISILFCLIGMVSGFIVETKEENYRLFAHIGLGINSVLLVFHILVYVFA